MIESCLLQYEIHLPTPISTGLNLRNPHIPILFYFREKFIEISSAKDFDHTVPLWFKPALRNGNNGLREFN